MLRRNYSNLVKVIFIYQFKYKEEKTNLLINNDKQKFFVLQPLQRQITGMILGIKINIYAL